MPNSVEREISVFGSTSVGKSALTLMFIENKFVENYDPTSAKSYTKTLDLHNNRYKLKVNDTAGLEEVSEIPNMYLNSHGFILVYSITNMQSFKVLETIYNKLCDEMSGEIKPILLVGNKLDLEEQRRVSTDDGRKLAEKFGATFLETSAKDLNVVVNVFQSILKKIDPPSVQTSNAANSRQQPQQQQQQNASSPRQQSNSAANSKSQQGQKCTIS